MKTTNIKGHPQAKVSEETVERQNQIILETSKRGR